ncbi:chitin deacetylase-like protein [Setomelanomma holmii]|uniref:Chitin deacetylase-like protein n=1 Tax=Setomelanomma holmii TaxID=210430 RepID=A0A9P4HDW1_9PLEO|nr:chitin deacetylase-like protein [Setomelanomma holmii]
MSVLTLVVYALVAIAMAKPIPDPLLVMRQAGPAAGQVITKCAAPRQIALAYDDGPYQYTHQLMHTGCIYGQKTALQNAYKAGHQIASHPWSHPSNLGSLSTADLTTQMTRLEQALVNIIGVKPTYRRPPYLATGGNMLSIMETLGYRVITGDIDTGDWNNQTPAQSEAKFTQAGAGGNGHIPLMHETYASTVDTLTPWLINWAKTNNLKLVTVAECLGDTTSAYKSETSNGQSSC